MPVVKKYDTHNAEEIKSTLTEIYKTRKDDDFIIRYVNEYYTIVNPMYQILDLRTIDILTDHLEEMGKKGFMFELCFNNLN
jgi:hypothetical protein